MLHSSIRTRAPFAVAEDRARLREEGVIAFPRFVDDATVSTIRAEIARLIVGHGPASTYGVFRNARGSVLVANQLDRESDVLFDLARSPELLAFAADMLGMSAISLHVEFFDRPIDQPDATPPHQDQVFYREDVGCAFAVSFWIALDDLTEESGLVEYARPVPSVLLPHDRSPSVDFSYQLADPSGFSFRRVHVPRGGCIVHHSYVVHRSGTNQSGRPRWAVVFNYRGSPTREARRRPVPL